MARYGAVFVWHAASAVAAWVLAPAGFAWMRAQRRAGGGSDAFVTHRRVMVAVVLLTVQTWALAIWRSHATPPGHLILGSLVTLLALVQGAFGILRPPVDAGYPRHVWAAAHRGLAIATIAVAAYTLHHSIYVFSLPAIPALVIHVLLGAALSLVAAVELVPKSLLMRATGHRASYFEGDCEALPKMDDEFGSNATVNFRVVEDVVDEEAALAFVTAASTSGHTRT